MHSLDLSSYSRDTLVDTLRVLKNYKNSLRQVGKRAQLVDTTTPVALPVTVEYIPTLDRALLEKTAAAAVKKFFPEFSSSDSEIVFIENPKLVS